MELIITMVAFLFLIAMIITIHEGGHFIVGRMCGMKMLEFSLGFGPIIYQRRFSKDQTLFTLRLLPIGGFVKPLDEASMPEEDWKNVSKEDKKRSFGEVARWKKGLMVAGGPFANFLLAFLVYFFAMTLVGTKGVDPIISEVIPHGVFDRAGIKAGDKIIEVDGNKVKVLGDAYSMLVNSMVQGQKIKIKTNRQDNVLLDFSNINLKEMTSDMGLMLGVYFSGEMGDIIIHKVNHDSPAEKAGIQVGDRIISVNEEPIKNIDKTISFINHHPNESLRFVIERNQEEINMEVTPQLEKEQGREVAKIGVQFFLKPSEEVKKVYYTPKEAVWNSIQKIVDSSYTSLIAVKKLVTGQMSTKAISGPLSIADYSGKSAQHGLFTYMMMIAAISIAIGVFNLLPIPALDGGHLAQYIIEWFIGYDVHPKILHYSQVLGFSIIMGIFAFSMCNDILRYFF